MRSCDFGRRTCSPENRRTPDFYLALPQATHAQLGGPISPAWDSLLEYPASHLAESLKRAESFSRETDIYHPVRDSFNDISHSALRRWSKSFATADLSDCPVLCWKRDLISREFARNGRLVITGGARQPAPGPATTPT